MSSKSGTGIGPGRIDMMGGVADYSGSMVLEIATHKTTTAIATLTSSGSNDEVKMTADGFGTVNVTLKPLRDAVAAGAYKDLDLKSIRAFLQSINVPGWVFYVYGSLAVFVRETGWLPATTEGLEFSTSSTVPAAQGVSSSASIEVATIRSLISLTGIEITALKTAHIAQAAENYVVSAPCGLMDQLASALGSPGKVLPILCRPDQCRALAPLPPTVAVVGWPSGVKHSVAASPYLTARTATFMGRRIVEELLGRKVQHIAELSPSVLYSVIDMVPESMTGAEFTAKYGSVDDNLSVIIPDTVYAVRSSAKFPVEESFRCSVALSLLTSLTGLEVGSPAYVDTLSQIGELMMQTHRGYGTIGLGCHETDIMIERLMAMGPSQGIYGARMSGGGSGGTVAVLCEKSSLPLVEKLATELTFGEPFPGLIQIFAEADENFKFRIKFVCTSCRDEAAKTSVFGWTDSEEIPGSRGNAHLVQKCKTCSNVFTVEILSKPAQLSLSADDAERGAPVATFDCRTCEPAGYEAGDGWAVVGPSGAVFSDVTLDEDFCDYDEKAEASITVSGVKGAFVTGAAGKKK